MIMNHIELALTGLTTVCLLLLPITLIVLRRISKELVSLNVTTSKLSETQSDRTESATALNDLSDSVAEMKRDFEWLVSDRMIELAVNMAGTGHPQDRISKHTGISASELDAIQKIAKH